MPAFAAINVEPEDNVEDEVDVTRRIQIDDALKLYQTALKFHAQGPKSFPEAEEAYDVLFKSAIFSYPEATTEYDRSERQPDPLLTPGPSFVASLDPAVLDDNSTGSSLPQAYYIAYKNHGQFLLDKVRHKARTRRAEGDNGGSIFEEVAVQDDSRNALDEFDAALDRDPSDAELWRRTSRVAAFLKSARIERYCLEAAIELDDDPAVVEVPPPSLAEGFAGEQLRNQLQELADDVSLSHPSMAPFLRREMAASLKRYLDPLPWLPNPTKTIAAPKGAASPPPSDKSSSRITITFTNPSWADLGLALVQSISERGISGKALHIDAPEMPDDHQIMQIEIDQQLSVLQQDTAHVDGGAKSVEDFKAEESGGADEEVTAKPNGAAASDDKEATALKDSTEKTGSQKDVSKERSASQSRKRSQSVAGLPEVADEDNGDTKRSKRIRRRETLAEEAADPNAVFAEQLQPFQDADQSVFRTLKTLLEKLGVQNIPALDETIEVCGQTADRISKLQNQPARDIRASLITSFKDDRAKILLSKKDTPVLGLEAFLERAKSGHQHPPERAALDEMRGLRAFVVMVNSGWYTIQDVVYEWISFMSQSYASLKWSETVKRAVVQVLNTFDDSIFRRICHEIVDREPGASRVRAVEESCSLVQMIFELYLDIYERITNPSSAVEKTVRAETKFRLDRWMSFASDLARSFPCGDSNLAFRFIWACVFSTTLAPGIPRDHILACWESLRQSLHEEEEKGTSVEVVLPNNAIMPDVSYKAADREISKLTTMDFFLSLFQEELKDPVAVIDKLEPVLNPDSVYVPIGDDSAAAQKPISECAAPELRDMWKFLRGSSTELRLFLWTRLADAYKEIDYTTKVFSCYLRSIEMIMDDLESESYLSTPQESTKLQTFMLLLKTLDEMTIQALHLAGNDPHAFDIVDEDHIRSSTAAVARINCMLHVAALHEDEVRIGMTSTASNSQTFHSFQTKLREMQVRAWSLQYTVVKAGLRLAAATSPLESRSSVAPSTPGLSPESAQAIETPSTAGSPGSRETPQPSPLPSLQLELADFIGAIHQVVGPRKYCKASNKIFLRLARSELLRMRGIENWEDYLGQVLYDLNGIKLGVGLSEVQEHGCPTERLERKNALALVDKVMALASGMQMKDLLKSDLKNTIEHMQQAIGQTKSTTQMIHNLRYFTEYLKRPIHPLRLYQAWKGVIELDTVPATTPDTVLARNGWFFLMGMVALTKFKGVDLNRRQTPGATDDLRVGAQYLRLQLQLTPARWDAWFRLAECSDYDLDETVLWSAEKMNKDRGELVKLQRSAIHCYTLALSYYRADPDELSGSDFDAVHDLYHNFGLRMYSSSREPFAMECFRHAEHERWFIAPDTLSTYKKLQHGEMTDYMVWKYAAGLFRRAMARRAKDWKSAYMLSKCLWKMYQKPLDELNQPERASHPSVDDVVRILEKTIEEVSLLPKPRHGQDPVLEPHYKMLSIADKLVRRGDMHAQAAADILQRQPYAIQQGATVSVTSTAEWDEFVVKSLQHLRDKDKSNWQHRMVIRHARILFGDCDLVEDTVPAVPEPTEAEKETEGENGATTVHGTNGTNGASKDTVKETAKTKATDAASKEGDKEDKSDAKPTDANNAKVSDAKGGGDANDNSADKGTDSGVDKISDKENGEGLEKMDVDKPPTDDVDAEKRATKTSDTKTTESSDSTVEMPLDNDGDVTITEGEPEDIVRQEKAKAAFAVLRESMFTKTMVMNVWKCDAERPGRHHVFTEQYIRFMTRLLVVMDDRINLEALLRRIRKKGADFYHFNDLWQTCVVSYLRLLRKFYKIPLAADDAFNNVTPEEFEIYAERISEWVGQPEADHRALRALREAIEIKKLNGNLMKASPIDDLISDCYSVIFADVGRKLPGEDPAKIIEERHRQQREEAEKAEKAEKAERAEKEKQAEASASTTAAIMLSFNLLSDRGGGGADKDSINGISRAGSEAPGAHLLAAEKMERQGSGMGGNQIHRRGRAPGVRRPDILRKAEQATSRLGDLAAKAGGAASGTGDHHGAGTAAAGTQSRRSGDGAGATGSMSRRSTRLGSSSSARHDLNMASAEALAGSGRDNSKDGDGSGGDGEGEAGDGTQSRGGSTRGRARSTRSRSRHLSVDNEREEGEGDAEMKDAREEDEEEEEEDGEENGEAGEGEGEEEDDGAADETRLSKSGGDGGSEAGSSPRGSVNDWADDESELSDVPPDYEENAPASLMFPNLRRSEEASGDEDGDDEADDDNDEEEEEEEEEGEEEGEEGEEGAEEEGEEDEGEEGESGEEIEDVEMEDKEAPSSPAAAADV